MADELFNRIDKSLENVNYEENRDKSFRRYCYTWNNPFFNDEFEEVDINSTDLPLRLDHYDLKSLKSEFNKDFFDFKYIKYENYKTKEFEVIERPFFKDSNCIRQYITNFSTFRYSMFQIEKGGNCETTHIQGFVTFKNPMTWSTFKNYFPCCHFNKCISSSADCRKYCSKEDTRIDGPYEDGDFVEERSRTDIKQFLEAIDLGVSQRELKEIYPTLYLKEYNKIEKIRNESIFEEYKKKYRNVEVTYIYGPPRCGKTSYIVKNFGYGNFYNVDTYRYGSFDKYSGEKVIVFDEYDSQIELTLFNKLLDGHPVQMPCRFENKFACYDKVFIISNLSLSDQYKSDNIKEQSRDAFVARIHNIYRFDDHGNMFVEQKKDLNSQMVIKEIVDNNIDDIFK